MELTDIERARFSRIIDAPSVAYIQVLAPDEFAKFIYYLFERDGLYMPVYVDGSGDGGVDIELHSLNGALPVLRTPDRGVEHCPTPLSGSGSGTWIRTRIG
jgi:hypothetical protein